MKYLKNNGHKLFEWTITINGSVVKDMWMMAYDLIIIKIVCLKTYGCTFKLYAFRLSFIHKCFDGFKI